MLWTLNVNINDKYLQFCKYNSLINIILIQDYIN